MNKKKKQKNKKKSEKGNFFLGKAIPKILMFAFIAVATVQAVNSVFLSMAPEYVYAQDRVLELQVPIGDTKEFTFDKTTGPIAEYIKVVYTYATGVVGIIAAVVLMWGGLLWLTSAGNSSRVGEAQAWIGASLTGLVLVFGSYLILYQINPKLTSFQKMTITEIGRRESPLGSEDCDWAKNQATPTFGTAMGSFATPASTAPVNQCSSLGDNWIKSDGKCSKSKPGNDYTCCCPPLAAGCLAGTRCKDCKDCKPLPNTIPYYDGQGKVSADEAQLNEDVIRKVTNCIVINGTGLTWRVSEAWPPSVLHERSCHQDGTCLDLDITNENNTAQFKQQLAAFYGLLKEDFPLTYWECQGVNCCANYPSEIQCRTAGTGTHFHIE